jgi:pyrroline-5-carboxylate reductase
MKRLGIIGYGTMGAAIARGIGAASADFRLAAYDKMPNRRSEAERGGIAVAPSVERLVAEAEILLVAVKPQDLAELLATVGRQVAGRHIVSIVAGRSMATFEKACGTREVARLMPNIAATVGLSYVGVSTHAGSSGELRASALAVASSIGVAVEVPERLLAAVTGVAGSGIAYVLAFAHALALGGVHAGMDYQSALRAAVQTMRGAAALMWPGGPDDAMGLPVDLLTRVTSPGGTTIEGIRALEDGGFTATVMRAVKAAADRAAQLEVQAG